MDNTKQFTAIEWCAGYGGIHLGLKRAIPNLRVIAYGEIEAFAVANLVAKMEAGLMDCAPVWSDLKTFPCEAFRDRVDLLVAGYPCQPFSAAGKRLGTEDPRHLWPHIARSIRIIRPRMCFFENVEGHISLGLREVIGELESMGYKVSWGIFSAREVGAPHQRKRVFILAYDSSQRLQISDWQRTAPTGQCDAEPKCGSLAELANAGGNGHDGRELQDRVEGWKSGELPQPRAGEPCGVWSEASGCGKAWPSRPGEPQHEWEPPRVVADTGSITRRKAGRQLQPDIVDACGRNAETAESCASGDQGVVANNNRPHAGHGEQRPERTLRALSGGCGEGSGNMAHSNRNEPSEGRGDNAEVLEVSSEQWKDNGSIISGGEGELSGEEVVGNATSERPGTLGTEPAGQQWQASITSTGDAMGNANSPRPQERTGQRGEGIQGIDADGGADASGEIEQPMGDPVDGTKFGVGLSELSGLSDSELAEICEWMVKTDNRTDELRLLGNGVVPATAERAFRILMEEL